MRIFYDHQVFSLQSHGGITGVFSEVIRYLSTQRDIATDVMLGFSDTQADFGFISSPSRVIHPGSAIFRQAKFNYVVNEAFTTLLAPLLGSYDIYHSTYHRFLPVVRAKYRVSTHHDCIQEMFPQLFPDSERTLRYKRAMFSASDLIVCVSHASRADLLRFYDIAPEKAIVVHNGVSLMKPNLQSASIRRELPSGKFLLYVGARHIYKNFNGLLHAFAAADLKHRYTLLAIGGGDPSVEHCELILRLGLQEHVQFIPYAPKDLLASAYSLTSLLVYPSLYEGFGLPPLEAASVGCVSLVAASPATLEICQDAVFFFDPLDPEDFASNLQLALTDTAGRANRLKKGQALLDRYTWRECGRKTLDAYLQLQKRHII